MKKRRVIIESPYAGDAATIARNERYARAAMRDCILRGEAPLAIHLLCTQPGVLDDRIPEERKLGMQAGFAWGDVAHATVVYEDLGITSGMKAGIDRAVAAGRPVEYRFIPGWTNDPSVQLRQRPGKPQKAPDAAPPASKGHESQNAPQGPRARPAALASGARASSAKGARGARGAS